MKNSTKKIFNKIKQNKVKIIFSSILMTTIIGCSIGLGLTLNVTKSSQVDKPVYTPELAPVKPGELRFDQTGKPIVPIIIDEQNPSGDYEHKIDKTLTINNKDKKEVLKSPENEKKLETKYTELIPSINKSFSAEELNTEIIIPNEIKQYINSYLPNNNIVAESNIKFEDFLASIQQSSFLYTQENSLSMQEVHDLLAFNGINFEKEYNAIITASEQKQTRGGGGISPPDVNIPNVPRPDLPSDNSKMTFMNALDVYVSDTTYRLIIEVVYSSVLLAISIAAFALAFITFVASLAFAMIDIIFCTIALVQVVDEYIRVNNDILSPLKEHKKVLENHFDIDTINSLNWFFITNFDNINNSENVKNLFDKFIGNSKQWKIFKDRSKNFSEFFTLKQKNIMKFLKLNIKTLSLSLSLLSLLLVVSKEITLAFFDKTIKYGGLSEKRY